MPTFTGQIAQSSDDATENATGTVSLTQTTLAGNVAWYGFRWTTTIPGAATVSAASISLWPTTSATINRSIDFQNSNNPATFATTTHNISGRTGTGSTVTWNTALTGSQFNASPDLTTPVQAVVNLSGFSSSPMVAFFSDLGTGPAIEAWDGNTAEAAKISVTYTSGSPPSAPTNLTAAYASPTSLNLTWTQGSNTPTDNHVQYSTDNATWTVVDVGSAVTSYTLTGLTANTLYYVQVNASNAGGTSSYSSSAYAPTQPTVSVSITLSPATDVTTTGWTNTGGAGSFAAALADGSDSTYLVPSASTGNVLTVALQNCPSNLICVTGITYNSRAETIAGGDTAACSFRAVQSDGITVLSDTQTPGPLTTSPANYTAVANVTVASTQGLAAWTGAKLLLTPPDANQDVKQFEGSVTITYLVPLVPRIVKHTGIATQTAVQVAARNHAAQPIVKPGANAAATNQPAPNRIVKHTNAAVEAAAHARQQQNPKPQVVPAPGRALPSQHIVRPLGSFVACQAAAQQAYYHQHLNNIQVIANNRGRFVGQQVVKQTHTANQAAVQAAAHNHPNQPQVLHGKTKVFVPAPPLTVTKVSAVQGPIALRQHQPVFRPQVKQGMTAQPAGPRIVKLLAAAAGIVNFLLRRPPQPRGGIAGEPKVEIGCYRMRRVDDGPDYYAPTVDDGIPYRMPTVDDGPSYYAPRPPDCCG